MITVSSVRAALPQGCEAILVDPSGLDREVTGPTTLDSPSPTGLAYVRYRGDEGVAAAQALVSAVVVIPASLDVKAESLSAVLVIRAHNPRLAFMRLVNALFATRPEAGVHPSALISANARIGKGTHVGPGCTIGACSIGDDCVLHAGVHIYDEVRIADGVTIHAGTTVGSDGFGYERDEDGVPVKFPHLGGVEIEDGVEIGANSVIDRGTIGDTIIERDAKLDNLVHIAHNVRVGSGSMIAASAVIAGSTSLGNRVWIGPLACVSNGLNVGDDAEVSLGAVVTRDVPAGTRVTGNFAVEHHAFLRQLRTRD